jgi:hypothetical protein
MLRKLRTLAVAAFLLCVCQSTSIATEAPPFKLDGYWGGVIERQGAKLGIKVEFKTETDGVKADIDIPGLYILPLPKLSLGMAPHIFSLRSRRQNRALSLPTF